jgi:hypothetical protein
MKKYVFLIVVFVFYIFSVNAQVGIGTTNPDASASLELNSNSSGVLIPRMTETEKNAIVSPANGLLIFQKDGIKGFHYYDSDLSIWKSLSDDLDADPNNEIELPTTFSIGAMTY